VGSRQIQSVSEHRTERVHLPRVVHECYSLQPRHIIDPHFDQISKKNASKPSVWSARDANGACPSATRVTLFSLQHNLCRISKKNSAKPTVWNARGTSIECHTLHPSAQSLHPSAIFERGELTPGRCVGRERGVAGAYPDCGVTQWAIRRSHPLFSWC